MQRHQKDLFLDFIDFAACEDVELEDVVYWVQTRSRILHFPSAFNFELYHCQPFAFLLSWVLARSALDFAIVNFLIHFRTEIEYAVPTSNHDSDWIQRTEVILVLLPAELYFSD